MKVRNKTTGAVVETSKQENGNYIVEGAICTAEEMRINYEIVKETKQAETRDSMIVSGDTGMSGNIGALAKGLSQCQGEFTAVYKGTSGHGYNYADIAAVLEVSSKITSKYGIAVTQMNLSKIIDGVLLTGVRTVLMHEEGGYIFGEVFMPTEKTKMNSLVQIAGVNITYLRRYGIQSALGLATTDNDGSDK